MTNALLSSGLPKHATPETAQRMMQCSKAFAAQRPESEADAAQALEVAAFLSRPATRIWIAGRVATLLSHYFVAHTEAAVAAAVAEDWCAMLEEYPAWAIANACRWWMSRDNPRKHCKPLPGDIQDRAHVETAPVRSAEVMARLGPLKSDRAATPKPRLSDEARRAILAEVGMTDPLAAATKRTPDCSK